MKDKSTGFLGSQLGLCTPRQEWLLTGHLTARMHALQATKMLNEEISSLVGGLRSSSDTSLSAFARMEQRVEALEAEADIAGQSGVSEQVPPDCRNCSSHHCAMLFASRRTHKDSRGCVCADRLLQTVPWHEAVWPGSLRDSSTCRWSGMRWTPDSR